MAERFRTVLLKRGLLLGSALLLAAVLASACGEREQESDEASQPQTSTATAGRTPTPTPSAANPTPTATGTSLPTPETAAYALECLVVNAQPQDSLPADVYAHRGTFIPAGATESEAMEVEALRVEITGETGEMERSGERSFGADYQGNLALTIDEERTYAKSQLTYRIVGKVSYRISDPTTLADYDIAVTGGGFGTAPKTCNGP